LVFNFKNPTFGISCFALSEKIQVGLLAPLILYRDCSSGEHGQGCGWL